MDVTTEVQAKMIMKSRQGKRVGFEMWRFRKARKRALNKLIQETKWKGRYTGRESWQNGR